MALSVLATIFSVYLSSSARALGMADTGVQVEALVVAANVTESKTTADPEMVEFARRLIAEAEARFDQELLRGTNEAGLQVRETFVVVEANLRRARELLNSLPGTAGVLASDVLRDINSLDVARQDVARMN